MKLLILLAILLLLSSCSVGTGQPLNPSINEGKSVPSPYTLSCIYVGHEVSRCANVEAVCYVSMYEGRTPSCFRK